MDIVYFILGGILLLAGLAGCFLPIIPGLPLGYISLILLQISSKHPFSTKFLIITAVLMGVVTILDYLVPVWGTKKFGGSKMGVRGSIIGLIIGMFFGPIGIILGPFAGAFIGELIAGKNTDLAFRSAIGSFIGFLAGVFMKVALIAYMGYHFLINVF